MDVVTKFLCETLKSHIKKYIRGRAIDERGIEDCIDRFFNRRTKFIKHTCDRHGMKRSIRNCESDESPYHDRDKIRRTRVETTAVTPRRTSYNCETDSTYDSPDQQSRSFHIPKKNLDASTVTPRRMLSKSESDSSSLSSPPAREHAEQKDSHQVVKRRRKKACVRTKLNRMNLDDLRKECLKRRIDNNGRRLQMIARILEYDATKITKRNKQQPLERPKIKIVPHTIDGKEYWVQEKTKFLFDDTDAVIGVLRDEGKIHTLNKKEKEDLQTLGISIKEHPEAVDEAADNTE